MNMNYHNICMIFTTMAFFPTKIIWKRMVNYKVKKKYCDQWAGRISADQSLQRVGLLSRNPLRQR